MATILLIDDSALALEITKELLMELGHHVLATDNPAEFFQLLVAEPRPQLAIVDAIMPEMSGVEIINKIRASTELGLAELPVVMASALDDQPLPAPGVLMLPKPFGLDELQMVLSFGLGY